MKVPRRLVDVVRSGFVEGHHYGSVVALTSDGQLDWSIGNVDAPIYPRSCNKPLQASAMLGLGLDLPDELVALASASHSGEPFHVQGVRQILASVGLGEQALGTPADYPLDDRARTALISSGVAAAPITMNCSGKHAAMLATCVVNGWPIESYLEAEHPLQAAIAMTFAELTAEPISSTGVDGCGAPLFSASLTGLARAFHRLVTAPPGSPGRRVARAVAAHPTYVSGTRRDEAALLGSIPGAIAKAGAESVYVLALPDGRAIALKIDDGSNRARPVVMAAALRRMGVDHMSGVDADALRATGYVPVMGGGRVVGELRPTL